MSMLLYSKKIQKDEKNLKLNTNIKEMTLIVYETANHSEKSQVLKKLQTKVSLHKDPEGKELYL